MPAKDIYHDTVRTVLEKDGWTITHDPYYLKVGGVEFYIDLGAETLIAAQRKNQKIAVEIKSFWFYRTYHVKIKKKALKLQK